MQNFYQTIEDVRKLFMAVRT